MITTGLPVNMFAKMVRGLAALVVPCLLSLALFGNANAAAPIVGFVVGSTEFPTLQKVSDRLTACQNYIAAYNTKNAKSYTIIVKTTDQSQCRVFNGSAAQFDIGISEFSNVCQYGGSPDTTKPTAQQCPDNPVPESCGAYPTKEIAANNSWANVKSCSCTWLDPLHQVQSCNCLNAVTDRPFKFDMTCRGVPDAGPSLNVKPVPTPEPPVEVDFPECAPGSYKYTDLDGHTECTTPVPPEETPQPCASGNVGTINGDLVCLPSNPAPGTAAAAAAAAQAKAAAAKAAAGTATAEQAAKDAAIEAQRAKDASDSLPGSVAAKDSLLKAIEAAKQASGYAGQPYGGPTASGTTSGSGSGGTGNTEGAKECGSPGRPKCQIDETGTPDGSTTKITDEQIKTLTDGREAEMNKKQGSWGLSWNFQLPQGACQPLDMTYKGKGKVVDWCPYLAKLRSMIGYFYVMLTLLGIYMSYSNAVKFNKG